MKTKYAVIITMFFVLVSCIPYDDDTCRMPMFGSKTYFKLDSSPEGDKKLHRVAIEIDATHGAELSGIIINASFPKEVRIGKAYSLSGNPISETEGVVIKSENNIVTYNFSRSIKADSILCGILIDALNNKWSKPIEVDISVNFKQVIKCSSGGMKNGRYTKKTTLIINPKDGKYYEREGRVEGEWVYAGE